MHIADTVVQEEFATEVEGIEEKQQFEVPPEVAKHLTLSRLKQVVWKKLFKV